MLGMLGMLASALLRHSKASRPRPMVMPVPRSSTYGSTRLPGSSQPHTSVLLYVLWRAAGFRV
jgi:hypothetical protein